MTKVGNRLLFIAVVMLLVNLVFASYISPLAGYWAASSAGSSAIAANLLDLVVQTITKATFPPADVIIFIGGLTLRWLSESQPK